MDHGSGCKPGRAGRAWLADLRTRAAAVCLAVTAAAVLTAPAAWANPGPPARPGTQAGPAARVRPAALAHPRAGHTGKPGQGAPDAGTNASRHAGSTAAVHPGTTTHRAAGARQASRGNPRLAPLGGRQLAGRGVIVNYPARGGRRLPHVRASAYVIADAGTGQVLAAKDPHGLYRPASTLKVLTAITLMKALKPNATVIASRRAAAVEPSKVGLIAGDRYRVSDLFKALLMISANDAAIALVQATGSYARGMAMINAEARHLRADDTVAVTPNGLDARGQHVSAYDEALFARQALAIPAFMHDERLLTFRFPLRPHRTRHHRHRMVTLYTQNTMLTTFRGDLGGKIGWTTPAKATFIGWARRGHTTLVVTILHCRPLAELTYAARLLNWGFAMDGKVRPIGHLVRPLPAVVARHHRPVLPEQRPARAAGSGLPGVPLTVGLVALLIAALTSTAIMIIGGRRRRAGNRPGS
jgi:D-alanyl-D-alanine carboxypeptidase (penicillin-binding protein 5/6)